MIMWQQSCSQLLSPNCIYLNQGAEVMLSVGQTDLSLHHLPCLGRTEGRSGTSTWRCSSCRVLSDCTTFLPQGIQHKILVGKTSTEMENEWVQHCWSFCATYKMKNIPLCFLSVAGQKRLTAVIPLDLQIIGTWVFRLQCFHYFVLPEAYSVAKNTIPFIRDAGFLPWFLVHWS